MKINEWSMQVKELETKQQNKRKQKEIILKPELKKLENYRKEE